YDCVSTGTQEMPPSWTNNTDPNVAWDLEGRVYQTTLPFNAYWTNLHPDGAIDLSYSDDMGLHWVKGNGGKDLEQSPNASSFQLGHVEDKQWVAVNDVPLRRRRPDVLALRRGGAGRGRAADDGSPEHALPRRDPRELRGQSDLSRPPVPRVRGLGRHPDGREVHAVHRRRLHVVGAGGGQRRLELVDHRPVPAVRRRRLG